MRSLCTSFVFLLAVFVCCALGASPAAAQELAVEPAQRLAHGSVAERQQAAHTLGNIADEAAEYALIDAMADPNPVVRGAVADALGKIGDGRAVPALAAALKDEFSVVVMHAVLALGMIEDPAASEALLPIALDDRHPQQRAALLALGDRTDLRVADRLVTCYLATPESANDAQRRHLEWAVQRYPLSRLEGPLLTALKHGEAGARPRAFTLLMHGQLTPSLTEAVLECCTDPQVGTQAVRALGHSTHPRALPRLLELLHHADAKWRRAALSELVERPEAAALDAICALLPQETDATVRAAAVSALAGYPDSKATTALLAALHDQDPSVVARAATALADRSDPRISPALLPLLQAPSTEVCAAVLTALGARAEPQAAPALITLLAAHLRKPEPSMPSGEDRVIASCRTALTRLRPAVRDAQVAMLQAGGAQAQDAIAVLSFVSDQRLVDPLLKMLQAPEEAQRLAAVRALGVTPGGSYGYYSEATTWPRGEGRFALTSTPFQLENQIAALLRQQHSPYNGTCWTRDPRVVKALTVLLDDRSSDVRCEAAWCLMRLGDPHAVPALLRAAQNTTDFPLQISAMFALAAIGDPRASALFKAGLTNPNKRIRDAAIQGCAHLPDQDALQALLPLIQQEKEKDARVTMLNAIGENPHPLAVQALVRNLQTDDPMWRDGTSWALCNRGDVRAVEALLAEQRNKFEWARSAAAEALLTIDDLRALPVMVAGLRDDNSRYRIRCAHWLVQHNDPHGLPAFLALLDDPDEMARGFAQEALADCHDPRVAPLLLTALRHPNAWPGEEPAAIPLFQAIPLLAELQDRRAVELLAALPAEDHYLAGLALAHFHDQRAIPLLQAILHDDHQRSLAIPAALALAEMVQAEGFTALAALARSTDECQRGMTLLALGESLPGEPPALKTALAASLTCPDALARVLAARALLARHDPRALPILEAAAQQEGDPTLRALARGILCTLTDSTLRAAPHAPLLLASLATEVQDSELNEFVRGESLRLLGALRAPQAQPLAESLVKSSSLPLREAAITTLGTLADSPRTVSPLLAALQDNDPYIRQAAAAGLGTLKNPTAIPPLIAVLGKEPVTIVRRAAATALWQLTGQQFGEDAARWQAWWQRKNGGTGGAQ